MESDIKVKMQEMGILVVDDIEDNIDLILALLEEEEYNNLLTAPNGKEALSILEGDENIDLVLLDINMPELNGYQVLEYIKSSEKLRAIPVIMVSALDEMDSTIRCIENGAEDYITKPVDETLLLARVNASLERKFLRNQERELFRQVEIEKQKSETVLYRVLPESVAERLKKGEENIAETIEDVTIVFSDLVGFTRLSSDMSPNRLVEILNDIFRSFDHLVAELKLEKVKTIGDAYMVVGGIPPHNENHADRCMEFALSALNEIDGFSKKYELDLKLRIGMCTGPVVAGVIGQTRFTYDLWGDTVNIASRMETLCFPGLIQVVESTYLKLQGKYPFAHRAEIEVKGKGMMKTYISGRENIDEIEALITSVNIKATSSGSS